jgi:hypothetical protein
MCVPARVRFISIFLIQFVLTFKPRTLFAESVAAGGAENFFFLQRVFDPCDCEICADPRRKTRRRASRDRAIIDLAQWRGIEPLCRSRRSVCWLGREGERRNDHLLKLACLKQSQQPVFRSPHLIQLGIRIHDDAMQVPDDVRHRGPQSSRSFGETEARSWQFSGRGKQGSHEMFVWGLLLTSSSYPSPTKGLRLIMD